MTLERPCNCYDETHYKQEQAKKAAIEELGGHYYCDAFYHTNREYLHPVTSEVMDVRDVKPNGFIPLKRRLSKLMEKYDEDTLSRCQKRRQYARTIVQHWRNCD